VDTSEKCDNRRRRCIGGREADPPKHYYTKENNEKLFKM
jgi:hypothetical protein